MGWAFGQQTTCTQAGTTNADPRCVWSGNTSGSITTGTGIGAGYANTAAMIAQSPTLGRAATVANAYRGRNLTDWFLPSRDELMKLFQVKDEIDVTIPSNGYWSSSQTSDTNAVFVAKTTFVGSNNVSKSLVLGVRAVRAF